jgi:hypothetical protein
MKYVITAEKLKIKLKDGTWVERRHCDDGLWFFLKGTRLSAFDVAQMCCLKSDYIKGLVEAGRSFYRISRIDRSKLEAIKEYVSYNDTPLLAGIKKLLARKYSL